MFDLYSLLNSLYKTTDALRTMRCKHQRIRDNRDRDISIDRDSIADHADEIREIEQQHIAAISHAYETLPSNLYYDVRDTVLKYAHRDSACGCCFTVKEYFKLSNMSERRIGKAFKGCKKMILERIRDEYDEISSMKKRNMPNIDESIVKSRKDRLMYIHDLYYDGPYLEPYNICLFWNVEYSKTPIGQLVCQLSDLEKRLEMDMESYQSGRGWGHY
jgi:hypothetical protein